MIYDIDRTDQVQEQIRRLAPGPKRDIRAAIHLLYQGPHAGNTKKLDGYDTLWRIRVGRWRVIFKLDEPDRDITILRVARREVVYDNLDDLLREEPPSPALRWCREERRIMVSQEQELTFEQRVAAQRKRDIERALAQGETELAKFLETVEYDDPTPDEVVAIERYFEDVAKGVKWEEPDTLLDEWRKEEPEFVAMLDRLDERFPGWWEIQYRLPEDHPKDLETLRLLDEHEPAVAAFVREIHDELRSI